MKKLDLNKYPSVEEIQTMFLWDLTEGLRWRKNCSLHKAEEKVTLYKEKSGRLRIRCRVNNKFVQLNLAVIIWVLTYKSFPSETGIFSLNGDNTDFSPGNWLEQQANQVEINGNNVRNYVAYDETTGKFRWKVRQPRNSNDRTFLKKHAGKPVTFRIHDGYQIFKISSKERKAHRWAWLYVYGELPQEGLVIDHIDRNPTNNTISNLRAVTQAENNRNRPNYTPPKKKRATPRKQAFPLTAEVKRNFDYDHIEGAFYWRKRKVVTKNDKRHNSLYAGKRAGRYTDGQPVILHLNKNRYVAQHMIWAYLGRPPPKFGLICINGNKHDLRPENWLENARQECSFDQEKDWKMKQVILKNLFYFEPEKGLLFRKKRVERTLSDVISNSKLVSKRPAGYRRNRYLYCTVLGKDYQVSHLAWLYVYGEWPPDMSLEIDHINRNSHDNRIKNLRLVTHFENSMNLPVMKNNTSGHSGVMRDSQKEGKWRAFLCKKTLGCFDTKDEAIAARKKALSRFSRWFS